MAALGRILTLLLCLAVPAQAVVFHDGVSNLQRTIEWALSMVEEVKLYVKTVEQVKQAYEQTRGIATMVEQGAKQIANMPKGANVMDTMSQSMSQTSAILGRVQTIGFELDRASQQFEKLYHLSGLAKRPEGRAEMVRQMRQARMSMTGMSMQVQSIQTSFSSIFERLSALLTAGSVAEGTKAMQQVILKQQALAQQQQQVGITIQAVHGRLEAMKQAEDMMMQELAALEMREQALRWYAYNRVTLDNYHGFMLQPQMVK